jgi:hypothetical protein
VRAAVTAARPGSSGAPGQRLRAIGQTVALWQRVAALRKRIAALRKRTAALRERTATLRERTAALRERTAALRKRTAGRRTALRDWIAAPRQRQVGLTSWLVDRSPPRQARTAWLRLTAAPGERVSRRRHWLVAIGHAAVS